MSLIISTAHLSLSAKSRQSVEELLAKLNPVLSENANIRLFLKKAPKDLLTAILKVHTRGKDFVVSKTGVDLENLVLDLETQLRRRLVDRNQRRVHLRKRKAF